MTDRRARRRGDPREDDILGVARGGAPGDQDVEGVGSRRPEHDAP